MTTDRERGLPRSNYSSPNIEGTYIDTLDPRQPVVRPIKRSTLSLAIAKAPQERIDDILERAFPTRKR
jgi:hypothetical protein